MRCLLLFFCMWMSAVAGESTELSLVKHAGLRGRVAALPEAARSKALATLAASPALLAESAHLRVTRDGTFFLLNCAPYRPAAPDPDPVAPRAAPQAAVPIADQPAYSSRPGASRVLFLDFNGHVVTGTAWNDDPDFGQDSWNAVPFSLDGDHTTFSDAEQEVIRLVWARVAEDYRPFDVNVTTVEPGAFDQRTGHVLITRSTDADDKECPAHTAGGVAFVAVFNSLSYPTRYAPAWVYYDNLGSIERTIAEAASHEFGHNLGLAHDGRAGAGNEYYAGHGSGYTWAPIMGAAYNRTITQWSRGEYVDANNTENDLAIIGAANRLALIGDDHGGTTATATVLPLVAGPGVARTIVAGTGGIVSSAGDSDLFAFSARTGAVQFTVSPFAVSSATLFTGTPGTNLDVYAEILDEAGLPVPGLVSDPVDAASATINGTLPASGTWYLRVCGAGNRDPASDGFSTYGSIGSYTVTGQVPGLSAGRFGFSAATVAVDEGQAGTSTLLLTVTRSAGTNGAVTVAYTTADLSATAGTDYLAASGTLSWADGDAQAQTITLTLLGDQEDEFDELFTIALSAPSGGASLDAHDEMQITLRNDDADPSVPAPTSGTISRGGGGGGGGCGAGGAAGLFTLLGALFVGRRRNRDAQA